MINAEKLVEEIRRELAPVEQEIRRHPTSLPLRRLELERLLEALGDLANELVLHHGSGTSGAAGIVVTAMEPLGIGAAR